MSGAPARFEMAFEGGDLGGLMFERVETVLVAGDQLERRHQRRHPQRHGEHDARRGIVRVPQQVPCADCADRKRGRQISGEHHVHQAIRE
jgi:hypothetical protein